MNIHAFTQLTLMFSSGYLASAKGVKGNPEKIIKYGGPENLINL